MLPLHLEPKHQNGTRDVFLCCCTHAVLQTKQARKNCQAGLFYFLCSFFSCAEPPDVKNGMVEKAKILQRTKRQHCIMPKT